MGEARVLDIEQFGFRDIHPNVFIGTASDRYAGWMEQIYRDELGPEGLSRLEYRLLETGDVHKPDDLHPGLAERIAATVRMPGEELPDDRPVEVLFDDWPATDEAVTRVYYESATLDNVA